MSEENGKEDVKIGHSSEWISFFEKSDNSLNKRYFSPVPEICKTEECLLGVDEAGRGPVLGPMVYGVCYAPISQKQKYKELGCADSKVLTEEQRDTIFNATCASNDSIGFAVDVISPRFIANSMYSRTKKSLNEVSKESAVELIKRVIDSGVNVTNVYVDTLGRDPSKYQGVLQAIFPDLKIVVEKKADATYPVVSAASICAKVARDHALKAWKFSESLEDDQLKKIGSGYPADPATKKWLTENIDPVFGFPSIVRFSWSTAEHIVKKECVRVDWLDDDDEESSNVQKISKFFAKSEPGKCAKKRFKFFDERCLTSTSNL